MHFELTWITHHLSVGLGAALLHLGRRAKDVQTSSSLCYSKCSAIQHKYNKNYVTQSSLRKKQRSPASVSFLKIHSALGASSTSIAKLSDNLSRPQFLQYKYIHLMKVTLRVGSLYPSWPGIRSVYRLSNAMLTVVHSKHHFILDPKVVSSPFIHYQATNVLDSPWQMNRSLASRP